MIDWVKSRKPIEKRKKREMRIGIAYNCKRRYCQNTHEDVSIECPRTYEHSKYVLHTKYRNWQTMKK